MIYLITTSSRLAFIDGKLDRLLNSISLQSKNICLLLVLQENDTAAAKTIENQYKFVQATHTKRKLGLSEARNIALKMLKNNMPQEDDLVGFPDDDAWFFPHFFKKLRNEITSEEDWISGSYSESEKKRNPVFPIREALLDADTILKCVCSITFFVRWRLVLKVGGFDERFGVGTRLNSSEDIDMGLRIWRAGGKGRYVYNLVVGHKLGVVLDGELIERDRPDYWGGSTALVFKHLRILPRPHRLIAGRIRRGMKLVWRGSLPFNLFLGIIMQSLTLILDNKKIDLDD